MRASDKFRRVAAPNQSRASVWSRSLGRSLCRCKRGHRVMLDHRCRTDCPPFYRVRSDKAIPDTGTRVVAPATSRRSRTRRHRVKFASHIHTVVPCEWADAVVSSCSRYARAFVYPSPVRYRVGYVPQQWQQPRPLPHVQRRQRVCGRPCARQFWRPCWNTNQLDDHSSGCRRVQEVAVPEDLAVRRTLVCVQRCAKVFQDIDAFRRPRER